MSTLLSSAEHWEALAASAEGMAKWDRDHGIDLSAPGQSVGDHQAEVYRRCARTLRLEHETGTPHCMCHEIPKPDCPYSGMGVIV
jgi:hypothetical protein